MSKYVPDILSKRWVIISSQRTNRPSDNHYHVKKTKKICNFCPGNEKYTPGEVLRYGKGEADKPGWQVRVIPNKYPITDFHEVIIHSPDDRDIETLPLPHVELIFKAYRERYNYYRKQGEVLIFCNHGEHAGASLMHPHSQLVVIPSQINLDALSREPLNNVVTENTFFNVYCPDFSQWPYEVWIAPKESTTTFGQITDDQLADLANILKNTLNQLKKIYEKNKFVIDLPFGYNYYIYPKENWYLRIIPRFIHRAGFELGTGLSVNVVDPVLAGNELREMDDRTAHVLDRLKKRI